MEYIYSKKDDLITAVRGIDYLAAQGAQLPEIKAAAAKCAQANDPIKCAFDFAYNSAVFRATPADRQQLRSVKNILREHKANCTGYVTIIGAILKNLNIPYIYRTTGPAPDFVSHIYLIVNNKVLDCTAGQAQDGNDNFLNRPKQGKYNFEAQSNYKKDFKSNMVTILNGSRRVNVRAGTSLLNGPKLNAIDPATAQAVADKLPEIIAAGKDAYNVVKGIVNNILGDPCKRKCDINHAFNSPMRKACKAVCDRETENETNLAFNYAQGLMTEQQRAATNKAGLFGIDEKILLPLAIAAGAYYFFFKK